MALECTSLHDNLDLFRHNRRDLVLPALAKAVHEEEPDNVYYLKGARFKVQFDNCDHAQAFADHINRRFADCTFTFLAACGQHIECRGLGFSFGLGINEDDAMDAFRGRMSVTQRRRYIHKSPDCLAKIEGLYRFRYPLIAFHIPPKSEKR